VKIIRIDKIKGHKIFRDFNWPSSLNNFENFNLIYGWNGSGKTTISNLFRAIENRKNIQEGVIEFSLQDGRIIDGSQISEQTSLPQVRVFNRDFVNDNVFSDAGEGIEPIFFFGENSIEKQKQVKRWKKEVEDYCKELVQKKIDAERAQTEEEKFCIDQGRSIKNALQVAGATRYNNYNQTKFREKAIMLLATPDDVSKKILFSAEYHKLQQISFSKTKEKINEITLPAINYAGLIEKVKKIIFATVVSCVMEKLRVNPEVERWVYSGLSLHSKVEEQTCLFCGQPLLNDRIIALESHFNDQYENLMKDISEALMAIRTLETNMDIAFPDSGSFYDDLQARYTEIKQQAINQIENFKTVLQAVAELLIEKKDKPFQSMNAKFEYQANFSAIPVINQIISEHNKRTENFDTEVNEARVRIEEHLISEVLEDFQLKASAIDITKKICNELDVEIKTLKLQITDTEDQILEQQKPATEISRDLCHYLGHSEITLEPLNKKPGYVILRREERANGLSEGEKTAIAFLYFLKSLEDKRFNLSQGIVVVDDPISSLDANSLYTAYGYLKERTREAAQLFVLTHNFVFFREVKEWFKYFKGNTVEPRKNALFQIECHYDGECRISSIINLHKVLKDYNSEYAYLFSQTHKLANSPNGEATLEEYYPAANIARRLLEMFLTFKMPSQLLAEKESNFESVIRGLNISVAHQTRLSRFLNAYSHKRYIGELEHDISILSETPAIMKDVLAVIQQYDAEHFNEMKKVIGL